MKSKKKKRKKKIYYTKHACNETLNRDVICTGYSCQFKSLINKKSQKTTEHQTERKDYFPPFRYTFT